MPKTECTTVEVREINGPHRTEKYHRALIADCFMGVKSSQLISFIGQGQYDQVYRVRFFISLN